MRRKRLTRRPDKPDDNRRTARQAGVHVMPVFPSVEWFNAVREIINHDQAYRHLGTCDALVGIDVSDKVYKLTFEAFEVTDVEEISCDEEKYLDFTLTT